MNLKEAGFKGVRAAVGEGMGLAVGTLTGGEAVVVARTPKGEGYTIYTTAHEALVAFESIAARANLQKV